MSYTVNPRAPKPSEDEIPQESTGPTASDSLAAESINASGRFAGNENADVMGVKGASSTLANTKTSGATVLRPAKDGTTREVEVEDEMGLGRDEKGTSGGVKYPEGLEKANFPGTHNADGYVGGPTGASTGTSTSAAQDYGSSTIGGGTTGVDPPTSSSTFDDSSTTGTDPGSAGVRPYVDTAPAYATDIQSEGQTKPKGDNLYEGDVPKTKTFTGDVGGPHDPGRLAEQQMLAKDASAAGEGVGGIRQGMEELDSGSGQYDVLSSERAGDQGINE